MSKSIRQRPGITNAQCRSCAAYHTLLRHGPSNSITKMLKPQEECVVPGSYNSEYFTLQSMSARHRAFRSFTTTSWTLLCALGSSLRVAETVRFRVLLDENAAGNTRYAMHLVFVVSPSKVLCNQDLQSPNPTSASSSAPFRKNFNCHCLHPPPIICLAQTVSSTIWRPSASPSPSSHRSMSPALTSKDAV